MRNVVLITLDSLRADHCSFMGYQRNTTPTIDKMARKGLCFYNAIASGVPTFTSLVGMFTGNYSLNDSLSGDIEESYKWREEIYLRKTLPQVLAKKGYNTAGFHGNPWASRFYGFNKGFKYFEDSIKPNDNYHVVLKKIFKRSRVLYDVCNNFMNFIKKESMFITWEKIYPHILEWKEKTKEPYFLWILLVDTHLPYIPPRKYRIFGCKSTLYLLYLNWILRKNWKIRKESFNSLMNKIQKRENNFNPKIREQIIKAYDNSVYYSDTFIKRLWRDLRDDDPIFIITADHGEGFGEHGFYYHPPLLYEELIHVPLVIFNADIKEKIDKPVSLVGLAPTILELLNFKNEFPSKSLLQDDKDWAISKVFVYGRRALSVRLKDWKLIVGQSKTYELYNLNEDPYEQKNLASQHPRIVKKLLKIAKSHIKYELEMRKLQKHLQKIRKIGRV